MFAIPKLFVSLHPQTKIIGKAQKKESSKMNGKLFLHQHRLGDVFLHL